MTSSLLKKVTGEQGQKILEGGGGVLRTVRGSCNVNLNHPPTRELEQNI